MQLIGRLHPALVHLPIGILLLACLFQWLVTRESYKKLQAAVGITLFWGMIFAILSCITGFILSNEGDYQGNLVNLHQWMGISVAVTAVILYILYKRSINASFAKWLSLIMVALIIIAGHLGASLTHGENFLTEGLSSNETAPIVKRPIPDVQAAQVYADIIQPIFQEKCNSCHGPGKQKGKLRLDNPEFILKGGKEGNDIIPGKPSESELIKRILLERNEDHHMPPKEKPQLSKNEIALLHWWVESGAHFDKQVKDLTQPEKISPVLLSLQKESVLENAKIPDLPVTSVEPANMEALSKLKARGVMVIPVTQNSNYLHANFVTVDSFTAKDLELLLPIKKQLIWLRLSNQPLVDSAVKTIAQLENIARLQLDRTLIADSALVYLKSLQQLKFLNLVGTNVTAKGLEALKDNKQLQSVFLFQTKVAPSEWQQLKSILPGVLLDSGGYKVPALDTDTIIVTEKNKYKRKD